jgi:hypothetical protein
MCGRSKDEVSLQVDHIKPFSQGGTDELNNLATLCNDCNAGKSNFAFTDYMSLNLVPDNIENHFKYYHDPKTGPLEIFHLYCFFKKPGGSLSSQDKFHHTWNITDTDVAISSNPSALIERRKKEEIIVFIYNIKKELIQLKKRLKYTEEGLELVS